VRLTGADFALHVALGLWFEYTFCVMSRRPSQAPVAILLLCIAAVTSSSCKQRPGAAAPSSLNASTGHAFSMIPDQVNSTAWQNAWTNLVNDARQSFTPAMPRLFGVEVQLVLANPGPPDDKLTLSLVDSTEKTIGMVSKTVSTSDFELVLFVFPSGGVRVLPGQLYALQLSGGTTFGWKYVVDGYEYGSASFNGKPLLPGARSTFLFQTFGTAAR
jgi:hypothetical protein